jgi:Uma2 family endonuclease
MLNSMSVVAKKGKVSYSDYVSSESMAVSKSEWINGVVYAMAGGTMLHARLAMSVGRALGDQLKGKSCAVFSSDLRIRSLFSEIASYPDLTVMCGTPQMHSQDQNACTNPTVIIEVLSISTETFDRGDKAAHYRRMPSMLAYVLVSTSEQRIEVFTRASDGTFVFAEAGPGQSLAISPIACNLAVDEIYFDPLAS